MFSGLGETPEPCSFIFFNSHFSKQLQMLHRTRNRTPICNKPLCGLSATGPFSASPPLEFLSAPALFRRLFSKREVGVVRGCRYSLFLSYFVKRQRVPVPHLGLFFQQGWKAGFIVHSLLYDPPLQSMLGVYSYLSHVKHSHISLFSPKKLSP